MVRVEGLISKSFFLLLSVIMLLPARDARAAAEWANHEEFNARVLPKVDGVIAALRKANKRLTDVTKARGIITILSRLMEKIPTQPVARLEASIGTMPSDEVLLGKLNEVFSQVQLLAAELKKKNLASYKKKKKRTIITVIGASPKASGGLRKRLAQFLRIIFVDIQTPPPADDPRYLGFYKSVWQRYGEVEQALDEVYSLLTGKKVKQSRSTVAQNAPSLSQPVAVPVKVQTVMVEDKQSKKALKALKKYVDEEFAAVRAERAPACGLQYDHVATAQENPSEINKTLSSFACELYRSTIMDMRAFVGTLSGVSTLHNCLPLLKDEQVIKGLNVVKGLADNHLHGLDLLRGLTPEQLAGLAQVKEIKSSQWQQLTSLATLTPHHMAGLEVCAAITDEQWSCLTSLKRLQEQHLKGLTHLALLTSKHIEGLQRMGSISDTHLDGLARLRDLTGDDLEALKLAASLTAQQRLGLEKVMRLDDSQLQGLADIATITPTQWKNLAMLKNISAQQFARLDVLQRITPTHLEGLVHMQKIKPEHLQGLEVTHKLTPRHLEGLVALAQPKNQELLQVLHNRSLTAGLAKLREPVVAGLAKLTDVATSGLRQLNTPAVASGLANLGGQQASGLARITPDVAGGLACLRTDGVARGLEKLQSDVTVMAAVQALGTGMGSAGIVEEATVNPIIRTYFAEGGAGKYRVEEIVDANLGHKVEELRVAVDRKLQMLIDAVNALGAR